MDERIKAFNEEEAGVMQTLREQLVTHNMHAVQIGFGRCSVGHKFQALMHALMLLSFQALMQFQSREELGDAHQRLRC